MKPKVTTGAISILALLLLLGGPTACGGGGDELPFGLKAETVASAQQVKPMVFAPDGRMFFAEQFLGNIRVLGADGQLQADPFATVPVAQYVTLDWGITGLALDPDFERNHYLYAFVTSPTGEGQPESEPVLIRFTDQDGRGVDEKVISDNFPQTFPEHQGYNANGNIHFGPDGFLYLSVGDYDTGKQPTPSATAAPAASPTATPPQLPLAQDLTTPVGKLLRVSKEDGSPAPGNPFANDPAADPRIFAYGFREPFDFAFHPRTKAVYGTDNTPFTCEELNIIEAGKNYSWPNVGEFPYADCSAEGQTPALYYFAQEGKKPEDYLSFVETSSLAFVSGATYPTLGDSLLVCELGSGVLRRLVLGGANFNQVTDDQVLVKDCKRGVTVSPDGIIYYSTETEIKKLIPPVSTPSGQ